MKSENNLIEVIVEERDRWSGPSTLDIMEFKAIKDADDFCKRFNAKNTSKVAPEYYTIARISR